MVFGVLNARVRDGIAQVATAVRAAMREALRPAPMASGFVHDLFRSRDELLAENAMLRQQLIVASRKVKQPKFRPLERGLVVALSSVVRNWQSAILLVNPDTVLRWHREGFRLLWKRKSRTTKQRQPRIPSETIELIRKMAGENKKWGAEGNSRRVLARMLHVASTGLIVARSASLEQDDGRWFGLPAVRPKVIMTFVRGITWLLLLAGTMSSCGGETPSTSRESNVEGRRPGAAGAGGVAGGTVPTGGTGGSGATILTCGSAECTHDEFCSTFVGGTGGTTYSCAPLRGCADCDCLGIANDSGCHCSEHEGWITVYCIGV